MLVADKQPVGHLPAGSMSQDLYSGILNEDSDEEIRVSGYSRSLAKKLLFFLTILMSGGTILLLTYCKPHIRLALMTRRSKLRSADIILVAVSSNYPSSRPS